LTTMILFLLIATAFEVLVILYAISLGLKDTSLLQWNLQFPGTSISVPLAISPLFHLVPLCVIATLAFSWLYLSRKVATKRQEIRRGKIENFPRQKVEKKGIISRVRRAARNFSRRVRSRFSGVNRLEQRVHLGRPTVRSAVIVLLIFLAFTLIFSLLAYPKLIYDGMSSLYQNNHGLLNFVNSVDNWVKGAGEALGPIGGMGKAITDGLIANSPGVRDFGLGLGGLIKPLASLDDAGKYLVLQNAAAWISVIVVLIYGERLGRVYKYKK
jgi:hypothetical protein